MLKLVNKKKYIMRYKHVKYIGYATTLVCLAVSSVAMIISWGNTNHMRIIDHIVNENYVLYLEIHFSFGFIFWALSLVAWFLILMKRLTLLFSYAAVAGLICLAQMIVLGVGFIIFPGNSVKESFSLKLESAFFEDYTTDDFIKKKIEEAQSEFHCCGFENYTDYKTILNCDELPRSCCGMKGTQICDPTKAYDGCKERIFHKLYMKLCASSGCSIIQCAFQIAPIISTLFLTRYRFLVTPTTATTVAEANKAHKENEDSAETKTRKGK